MTQPRLRVHIDRGPVPLWLVLVVLAPLGLVFLTSLLLAFAIIAAGATLAALLLPRFWKRPAADRLRGDSSTIELDSTQYRRLPPKE